jgi:eukaryotic-like serine/threonine-protein kinase
MAGARDSPEGTPRRTTPLWAEFDAKVAVLELAVVRVEQAISTVGLIIALYVAAFVVPVMGRTLAICSAFTIAWFSLVRALLARGRAVRTLRVVNPLVELLIPGIGLVVMAHTQGAAYALGSWVPPMLFVFLVLLSILRLQPALPLVIGVVGGAEYLLVYVLVLRREPMLGYLDGALYRLPMQVVRSISILLFGAMGMAVSATLRRTVGQAASQTRARDLFGKYRIGAKIASGGMGTVYEALYCPEGGFQRKVAIKRVHAHLAQEASFVDSFRAEAELGARLAHPNIVAVFDFGLVEDTYFFAMEHIEGMDLLRLRKRCKAAGLVIPAPLVAIIGREIAAGLAFAHEIALGADGRPMRVVHRDLNPSNVLVSRTGQVKISDFGVAKALGDERKHATRHFVGKMSYVAPEQAKGEAFDARADLFSLGLVIWELLCLRRVFERDTEAETLLAVMGTVAPPPSALRPELAAGPWDAFLAKALQPDPGMRFQTAAEMVSALNALMDHEGVPRPDDLSNFLQDVERLAPTAMVSSASDRSSEGSSRTEAATVREIG